MDRPGLADRLSMNRRFGQRVLNGSVKQPEFFKVVGASAPWLVSSDCRAHGGTTAGGIAACSRTGCNVYLSSPDPDFEAKLLDVDVL
jgi:hypothetical protein